LVEAPFASLSPDCDQGLCSSAWTRGQAWSGLRSEEDLWVAQASSGRALVVMVEPTDLSYLDDATSVRRKSLPTLGLSISSDMWVRQRWS